MPLMLDENQFDQFFDYDKNVGHLARERLIELSFHKVSKRVNSPKNNSIKLTENI